MGHWFLDRLAEFADRPAMIWRERHYSYGELLSGAVRWRRELAKRHVGPGESVAFFGDYSPATTMLLLALIANRNVAVPLTRSVGRRKERFLAIAEASAVIEFDGDDDWRFSPRAGGEHPLLLELRRRREPGLVVFSSGSTGEVKASLHSLDRTLDKFKPRRHQLRAVVFLLMDHLGGLNTLFYILSNGGTAVSIADRSPETICRTIERHRVELLPTTPTFLNMLLISEAYKDHDLSSLKLITYGSEPMQASTLRALSQVFSDVRLKQTYGLSEVGALRTVSPDPGSLWMKVGGEQFETRVVDGILWIRAASAMLGYLNAPSPFVDGGWFNTGDMVEVKGEYIRVLGRASEIINVGGEKVYPAEVESVVLEMDNVRDVSVRGRPNPVTGQVVTATVNLFEPVAAHLVTRQIQEFCKNRLPRYKIPVVVEIAHEELHGDRFKRVRNAAAGGGT